MIRQFVYSILFIEEIQRSFDTAPSLDLTWYNVYDLLPSINNPFTAPTVAGMQALWVIYCRVKENVYILIYRMQSKW